MLSHPQGLAQCARWLRETLPAARGSRANVDRGGRRARSPRRRRLAPRSAPPLAGELYGAVTLAEDLGDEPANATRFVWLAPRGRQPRRRTPAAGRLEELGRLLRRRRRVARLARALPVGVRVPRREPHADRVAPGAAAPGPLRLPARPRRAAPTARARPPRRSPALSAHCEELRVLGSYPRAAGAPSRRDTRRIASGPPIDFRAEHRWQRLRHQPQSGPRRSTGTGRADVMVAGCWC